jgi:hypothetical protein
MAPILCQKCGYAVGRVAAMSCTTWLCPARAAIRAMERVPEFQTPVITPAAENE